MYEAQTLLAQQWDGLIRALSGYGFLIPSPIRSPPFPLIYGVFSTTQCNLMTPATSSMPLKCSDNVWALWTSDLVCVVFRMLRSSYHLWMNDYCIGVAHHPIESDHVFPVDVVERHMTFHHLAQRVDVLPRSPTVLFCTCIVVTECPKNIDLTDDPPHQLDGRVEGDRVIMSLITTNWYVNLSTES